MVLFYVVIGLLAMAICFAIIMCTMQRGELTRKQLGQNILLYRSKKSSLSKRIHKPLAPQYYDIQRNKAAYNDASKSRASSHYSWGKSSISGSDSENNSLYIRGIPDEEELLLQVNQEEYFI